MTNTLQDMLLQENNQHHWFKSDSTSRPPPPRQHKQHDCDMNKLLHFQQSTNEGYPSARYQSPRTQFNKVIKHEIHYYAVFGASSPEIVSYQLPLPRKKILLFYLKKKGIFTVNHIIHLTYPGTICMFYGKDRFIYAKRSS